MVDEFLGDADVRMDRSVEALGRELDHIRTGRASSTLVEGLLVDAYGAPTDLKSLATIAAPEARLLVIQPWDRSLVEAVIKAVETSDIGINPSTDGSVIRLPFPPLSAERRQELVRLVHRKVEDGRVAVRNIRRHIADDIRTAAKEKMCSEDEAHRGLEQLDRVTRTKIDRIDDLGRSKEAEVLEI